MVGTCAFVGLLSITTAKRKLPLHGFGSLAPLSFGAGSLLDEFVNTFLRSQETSLPKFSWIVLIIFILSFYSSPSNAHANTHVNDEASTESNRFQFGVAGIMYSRYPLSIEDPGIALQIVKPFWLGERHPYFQWVFDLGFGVGLTTESHHVQLNTHIVFGFDLFFGDFFGVELRIGPAIFGQLGQDNVFGMGMQGTGGYVFRFWDDDRQRLKLLVHTQMGSYIANDPGNDIGLNGTALGVGLHYHFAY